RVLHDPPRFRGNACPRGGRFAFGVNPGVDVVDHFSELGKEHRIRLAGLGCVPMTLRPASRR
ncbi:MAG: hypothetical protein OXR73_18585, partial [Myxococcales bacterium]|nr:hypothetical protein [Myxococcales bacterium]